MVVMTAPTPVHVPVLLNESLQLLDVREGGVYIDCTTGLGGHSSAIAGRMGETGRLLCLDQDREALEFARSVPDVRRGSIEVRPVAVYD